MSHLSNTCDGPTTCRRRGADTRVRLYQRNIVGADPRVGPEGGPAQDTPNPHGFQRGSRAVAAPPSSAATVQSRLAESMARKKGRGSSVTYTVSRPAPRVSTATARGRPLTSLWTVTRNMPAPGAVSLRV